MSTGYLRKKQPELVRRTLLSCAERLAVELGLAGVTVQAVSEAAGVTKGGLLHHFQTKQALVEGMFENILKRLDAELDDGIARDPETWGSFTRAYLDTVFVGHEFGLKGPWAALSVSMIAEPGLRRIWADWLDARLRRHRETDSDPILEIVRLAADGAWLALALRDDSTPAADIADLRARLLSLTRR